MDCCVQYWSISPHGLSNCIIVLLLMLLDIMNCSDGSTDSPVYTTTSCTTLNSSVKIPCIQHLFIQHSTYCNTERLEGQFPHLYSKPEPSLKFPGPVRLLEPKHSNITWDVRQDGNVYYLKGFQITQTGTEMSNFGSVQCAVIDISNLTETELTLLPNMIFSIDFKRPGGYSVEVRSLPLGYSDIEDSVSITQDPVYEVYHPPIDVTLTFKQTNQSCGNISLLILPEVEGANQINIDTFYNGVYLQNQSAAIPYEVLQYIPICDLAIGNYTMKISLLDDSLYSGNPDKCLCYKGTPELFTCQSCKEYSRTFSVIKDKPAIRVLAERSHVVTITMAIISPIVVLAVVTGGLGVLYRRRGKQLPACWKTTSTRSQQDDVTLQTVCIVYSYDNESHAHVVQAFIELIEATCSCTVKTFNVQNKTSPTGAFQLDTSTSRDALEECDVIVVVHSEYLHFLVSESDVLQQSDWRTAEDICIISGLSKIRNSPCFSQKTISVYFEYTDKAFVNLLASESLFYLPLQSNKLKCHLVNNTGLSEKTDTSETLSNEKESHFISAVNSAQLYQKYHPKWLSVKLFNMQHSFSSDDSGIIITNQQLRRQRSVRSKSADTVCKCEMQQPINNCSNCHKVKLRRHSYDLSFCPPDTISDDVSVRLSLLESRLVAFNERYEFIVNNNVHPDDEYECMTIYHNNV